MATRERPPLLSGAPKVVCAGLRSFALSLAEQGVEVVAMDFRPPAGGDAKTLELLERLRDWER